MSDHRKGTVPPLCHPTQRQVLPIESPAGGHAPGEAADSGLLEVRDAEDIGSDDGHGVGGVHEEAVLPENHVAVLARTREKTAHVPALCKQAAIQNPSTSQAQPVNPVTWRFLTALN